MRIRGWLGIAAVGLALSGCGRGVTDGGADNGIVARMVSMRNQSYLAIQAADPDQIVCFPTLAVGYIERNGSRWGFDGVKWRDNITVKLSMLDFSDVAMLRSGTTLCFPVATEIGGDVVIDVPDAYTRELEAYCHRNRIRLWSGKIVLRRW